MLVLLCFIVASPVSNNRYLPRSSDTPAEDLLQVMKGFVEGYARNLREVRHAVTDSLSDAWDPENDPVAILMEPYDKDSVQHMITTHAADNLQFAKIALSICVVVSEMKYMCRTVSHAAVSVMQSPFVC